MTYEPLWLSPPLSQTPSLPSPQSFSHAPFPSPHLPAPIPTIPLPPPQPPSAHLPASALETSQSSEKRSELRPPWYRHSMTTVSTAETISMATAPLTTAALSSTTLRTTMTMTTKSGTTTTVGADRNFTSGASLPSFQLPPGDTTYS